MNLPMGDAVLESGNRYCSVNIAALSTSKKTGVAASAVMFLFIKILDMV
jgi:hypothetical protein